MVFRCAIINFIRNRRATAVSVCAAAALVAFIVIFADSIRLAALELDEAYETIPVKAYITSANAAQSPSLRRELFDDITASPNVASYRAVIQVGVGSNDTLRAMDDIAIDPTLNEQAPGIEWQERYGIDFFTGVEAVCLAPRNCGYVPGDKLVLELRGAQGVEAELTVIGVYGSEHASASDGCTYYCPLVYLRSLLESANANYSYSALDMTLCLTRELDSFKQHMRELGLDSGLTRLVIDDALLINVTDALAKQLSLLRLLLPAFLALTALMGFVLSFLLLRGRRREAAVMRSLGAGRAVVFGTLIMETVMQALCGAALGMLTALVFVAPAAQSYLYAPAVLGCYTLGGAAAVVKLVSMNVFTLMHTIKD